MNEKDKILKELYNLIYSCGDEYHCDTCILSNNEDIRGYDLCDRIVELGKEYKNGL